METPEEQPTPAPITVLVADNHPLMRQRIMLSLRGAEDIAVVGEAANGDEVLACVGFLRPGIVILDLDLRSDGGLSVVRELNQRQSSIGVIILTLHTDVDLLHRAMELGVRGYISKSSPAIQFMKAVRQVAGGGSYFNQEILGALEGTRAKAPLLPTELEHLTALELQMLRAIAEGKSSREMAMALSLGERAFEKYRTRICGKLDLAGPNALLQFALQQREILFRLVK